MFVLNGSVYANEKSENIQVVSVKITDVVCDVAFFKVILTLIPVIKFFNFNARRCV